jgi:hypothetical protein
MSIVDVNANPPKRGPNAKAVSVTVSFSGTDASVIQSDNYLLAGIAAQGPDRVHGGNDAIDWGYLMALDLDGGKSTPYIHMEVLEGHEWNLPWPGPHMDFYAGWNAYISGIGISSTVTLTMQWRDSSLSYSPLDYFATVNGYSYSLGTFFPADTSSPYFMTGTQQRQWPLPGTVKWLQFFGACSNYNIGRMGWHSCLTAPSYIETGASSWTRIPYAYSTDGRYAFMDNTLKWGGDCYNNVYATRSGNCVYFYPTSDGTTLSPDKELWRPAGGCPYVYVWDGQQYVMDNNILPASVMSHGADVEDYYRLEQPLIPVYQGTSSSFYSLQIHEFEHEHDFIDQVQLLAVDHNPDANIAVTANGEIVTYKNPSTPLSCVDGNGADRLNEISRIDGNVSDPATYFEGYPDDYLILNFGKVKSDNAKLILKTDMKKPTEECIDVQVKNSNRAWQTVEVIIPHDYWAIDAVNLSPYIHGYNDLSIRVFWKSHHRLDYVGLDTSPQADFERRDATLVSATHSTEGGILPKLVLDDKKYAELMPGQTIQLTFLLPNNQTKERTFILYTKGHYNTIA